MKIENSEPNMILMLGDEVISTHRREAEALVSAINHGAGDYRVVRPDISIKIVTGIEE